MSVLFAGFSSFAQALFKRSFKNIENHLCYYPPQKIEFLEPNKILSISISHNCLIIIHNDLKVYAIGNSPFSTKGNCVLRNDINSSQKTEEIKWKTKQLSKEMQEICFDFFPADKLSDIYCSETFSVILTTKNKLILIDFLRSALNPIGSQLATKPSRMKVFPKLDLIAVFDVKNENLYLVDIQKKNINSQNIVKIPLLEHIIDVCCCCNDKVNIIFIYLLGISGKVYLCNIDFSRDLQTNDFKKGEKLPTNKTSKSIEEIETLKNHRIKQISGNYLCSSCLALAENGDIFGVGFSLGNEKENKNVKSVFKTTQIEKGNSDEFLFFKEIILAPTNGNEQTNEKNEIDDFNYKIIIDSISIHNYQSFCFVTNDKKLIVSGPNSFGQMTIPSSEKYISSPMFSNFENGKISFIFCEKDFSLIFLNCDTNSNVLKQNHFKEKGAKILKKENEGKDEIIQRLTNEVTEKQNQLNLKSNEIKSFSEENKKCFRDFLFDIFFYKPSSESENGINLKKYVKYAKNSSPEHHNDYINYDKLPNIDDYMLAPKDKKVKIKTNHIEKIGRGATAEVSKVEMIFKKGQRNIKKEILAMKEIFTLNELIFRNFIREFEILMNVHHPCIVLVKRVNIHPAQLFMEFLPNSLEDELKYLGKIKVSKSERNSTINIIKNTRIVMIIVEIALGMRFIHKHHILHRDLKPANIMLTDTKHVKICDFGLATLNSLDISLTKGVGTLQYMAPQLLAMEEYSNKCDVFSFGILLLYILINTNDNNIIKNNKIEKHNVIDDNNMNMRFNQVIKFNLRDRANGMKIHVPDFLPLFIKDVIEKCLKYKESERPSFEEIVDEMKKIGFRILEDVDVMLIKDRVNLIETYENSLTLQ